MVLLREAFIFPALDFRNRWLKVANILLIHEKETISQFSSHETEFEIYYLL